jgi:hypothetical protein
VYSIYDIRKAYDLGRGSIFFLLSSFKKQKQYVMFLSCVSLFFHVTKTRGYRLHICKLLILAKKEFFLATKKRKSLIMGHERTKNKERNT